MISEEDKNMGCLAHEERIALDSYIEKTLEERETTTVNIEGSVNINTGPNYKKLTLKQVQDTYRTSKEWGKIQSFFCIPNLEKRDFKMKDQRQEIIEKHEKLLLENTEDKAEVLMQKDKQFKLFEKVLTNETELELRQLILEAMEGSPGLLLRSVETDKVVSQDKMENLNELSDLGIEIPVYNCNNLEHAKTGHKDQCYRSENDFILMYVEGDKLCIRFIEVKRPNTTPWAKEDKLPGIVMVKKCLEQLEKGVNFILSIIPDIPSENLDIKAFSAFPETPCANIFCQDCQAKVISREDVEQIETNKSTMRNKISIPDDIEPPSQSSLEYLLNATSRLVGNASLLHRGVRNLSDPFTQEKQTMRQTSDKLEKTFLFLNDVQRDLLMNVNINSPDTNYCFIGGSGTGKTQMALEVIKKLLVKHAGKPIRLIMSSCQQGETNCQTGNSETELLKLFQRQTYLTNDLLKVSIATFGEIIKELKTKNKSFKMEFKEKFEVPKKRMYKMPKLVDVMCKKLAELHKDEHVIFFLDEIMTFGNPDSLDWTRLEPEPSITVLLAFSPVSLGKGTTQLVSGSEEFITEDSSECLKPPTNFEQVILDQRYRNSRSIQNLTSFVGHEVGKYLTSKEKPATDVVGDIPVWIDIAWDKHKIMPAIEELKKYIEHDKKSEMFLLYDRFLPQDSKDILNNLKQPRSEGGFGWKVMEERLFHGYECDTVIYVGSGHLEAFTRARLKLLIVTFSEDVDNQWYQAYQSALKGAAEINLIKKDSLVKSD